MALTLPAFDVGAAVMIQPLDNMPARVVSLTRTAEEGWVYEVRYIDRAEAKTMRCFPDELVEPFRLVPDDVRQVWP